MTLADLLDFNADQLDTISETELLKLCEPFFNVTRPTGEIKQVTSLNFNKSSPARRTLSPEETEKKARIEQAKALAMKLGIKIG